MGIKVYNSKISKEELEILAQDVYGDMVKGVVDLQKKIVALGGELHSDCEEVLLDQGSKQPDLWGFNVYLKKSKEDRLEYTSFINIRPKQGNFQIEIKDEKLRHQIKIIIDGFLD